MDTVWREGCNMLGNNMLSHLPTTQGNNNGKSINQA
jgi:hypothetical protein